MVKGVTSIRNVFFGLLIASAFLPTAASAQQIQVLAINFLADGQVVELDVPPSRDGDTFAFIWGDDNSLHTRIGRARAGKHCYELRHVPQWRGQIPKLGITLAGISGRLKTPTFSDEIDMFLEPERIGLGTMNFLLGHTLFGWTWNAFLVLILAISALYFAISRKMSLPVSLVLGFLVCWALLDLRTTYDHAITAYTMESQHEGLYLIKDLKVFADRASEIIGSGSWSHEQLGQVAGDFVRYRLAEQSYVPEGSSKSPDFLITRDPQNRPVVWKYADYYLVKETHP